MSFKLSVALCNNIECWLSTILLHRIFRRTSIRLLEAEKPWQLSLRSGDLQNWRSRSRRNGMIFEENSCLLARPSPAKIRRRSRRRQSSQKSTQRMTCGMPQRQDAALSCLSLPYHLSFAACLTLSLSAFLILFLLYRYN